MPTLLQIHAYLLQFVILVSCRDAVLSFDPNGYVLYCPCMGRFGNQAEHLLGSLAFAKGIDRTLVLPPWPTMQGFVEFDQWFDLNVIMDYHRVITSEVFMRDLAERTWPIDSRVGFCYNHKPAHHDKCQMKNGSPFSEFWNHLDVEFIDSVFYNISYLPHTYGLWKDYYPPSDVPVIALRGAPAPYPVDEANMKLHKYLIWTDRMVKGAMTLLADRIGDERYIAVHLRNGYDWDQACQRAVGLLHFMASPQCLGYHNNRPITMELCYPSADTVISDIGKAVQQTGITNVVVVTDKSPLIREIEGALPNVRAHHIDPDIPQHDIIIASRADLFIGNCVSSFTAFIKRERTFVQNKPSTYFGLVSLNESQL